MFLMPFLRLTSSGFAIRLMVGVLGSGKIFEDFMALTA